MATDYVEFSGGAGALTGRRKRKREEDSYESDSKYSEESRPRRNTERRSAEEEEDAEGASSGSSKRSKNESGTSKGSKFPDGSPGESPGSGASEGEEEVSSGFWSEGASEEAPPAGDAKAEFSRRAMSLRRHVRITKRIFERMETKKKEGEPLRLPKFRKEEVEVGMVEEVLPEVKQFYAEAVSAVTDVILKDRPQEYVIMTSYDQFLKRVVLVGIDRTLQMSNCYGDHLISFGEVVPGSPEYSLQQCRLFDKSYMLPLSVNVTYKLGKDGEMKRKFSHLMPLGEVPLMVGSYMCPKAKMTHSEQIEVGEDPREPGGYFIMNGKEVYIPVGNSLRKDLPLVMKCFGTNADTYFSKCTLVSRSNDRAIFKNSLMVRTDGRVEYAINVGEGNVFKVPIETLLSFICDAQLPALDVVGHRRREKDSRKGDDEYGQGKGLSLQQWLHLLISELRQDDVDDKKIEMEQEEEEEVNVNDEE